MTDSITKIVDKGTLRMKEILRQVANPTRSIQETHLDIHLDNTQTVFLEVKPSMAAGTKPYARPTQGFQRLKLRRRASCAILS